MPRSAIPPLSLALLALVAACGGGAKHPQLASATVDTLPGGIVSVTSSGPTKWTDSAGDRRLVERSRVGGEEGAGVELSDPQSIALDDAGRLYVADDKPAVIKVIGRDGKLIRTIGREGEGPGEFKVAILATHGSNLIVHDPQLARTTVFDTSGKYLRSWSSSCCYWTDIAVDRNGVIYIPTMRQGPNDQSAIRYARWRIDGTAIDTVAVPGHGEVKTWTITSGGSKNKAMMSTLVPFAPDTRSGINSAGGFIYGFTGDYKLVVSPNGKDTTRIFGRSWSPAPLSDERKHAAVEDMIKGMKGNWDETLLRNAFHESDIPGTVPAFESVDVDRDGNVWLRLDNGGDSTTTRLDVFDSTGAYLGPVRLHRHLRLYPGWAWGRDEVAMLAESQDGLPMVVRYGSGEVAVGGDAGR